MHVRYFVDTTFLVARFHKDDENHDRALGFLEDLAQKPASRPRLVLTDYVFDETVTTLLGHSRSHRVAAAAGETIRSSRTTEILLVDRSMLDAAWRLFLARPDKMWSFTDCVSFETMRRFGLREALSFDENFTQAGFVCRP